MKVGLLTFHRADSIGALLQAYALQTAVTDLGGICEFVDLPEIEKKDGASLFVSDMKNADFFVKKIEANRIRRKELFSSFRTEHLHISEYYPDYTGLNAAYDAFIVGSDQVWNYAIPDTDDRYFLPFADHEKCFSYAASFGGEPVPKDKRQFVSERLKSFARISVREEGGRDAVRELTGRDCEVCVDPTFLLTEREWNLLTHPIEEKFVFVYMVQYSEKLVARAKEYAASHGLGMKIIAAFFNFRLGLDAWSRYGICDFLSFIRYADKVFTNSFHGMALSVIYGKPMETVSLYGQLKSRNSRTTELLLSRSEIPEAAKRSKKYLHEMIGD